MLISRVAGSVAVAVALTWATFATAQVSSADSASEPDNPETPVNTEAEVPTEIPEELFKSRVMDEIVVIAGPQGQTRFELELERLENMREVVYAEMRLREREQEELAWRQADVDLQQPESRIKWGYSPQAEQRMRRESDFLYDLPTDQVKPATLFRAEF